MCECFAPNTLAAPFAVPKLEDSADSQTRYSWLFNDPTFSDVLIEVTLTTSSNDSGTNSADQDVSTQSAPPVQSTSCVQSHPQIQSNHVSTSTDPLHHRHLLDPLPEPSTSQQTNGSSPTNSSQHQPIHVSQVKMEEVLDVEVHPRRFHAHAVILAAASPYFRTQLEKHTATGMITLKVTWEERHVAERMLEFVYTGQLGIDDDHELLLCMILANKYMVQSCVRVCCEVLGQNLKVLSSEAQWTLVQDILRLPASLTSAASITDLLSQARSIAHQQFLPLETAWRDPVKLGQFVGLPFHCLLDLLSSDSLQVASENTVFVAASTWVMHRRTAKQAELTTAQLTDIASRIRFQHMTSTFLAEIVPQAGWLSDVPCWSEMLHAVLRYTSASAKVRSLLHKLHNQPPVLSLPPRALLTVTPPPPPIPADTPTLSIPHPTPENAHHVAVLSRKLKLAGTQHRPDAVTLPAGRRMPDSQPEADQKPGSLRLPAHNVAEPRVAIATSTWPASSQPLSTACRPLEALQQGRGTALAGSAHLDACRSLPPLKIPCVLALSGLQAWYRSRNSSSGASITAALSREYFYNGFSWRLVIRTSSDLSVRHSSISLGVECGVNVGTQKLQLARVVHVPVKVEVWARLKTDVHRRCFDGFVSLGPGAPAVCWFTSFFGDGQDGQSWDKFLHCGRLVLGCTILECE